MDNGIQSLDQPINEDDFNLLKWDIQLVCQLEARDWCRKLQLDGWWAIAFAQQGV
jgi:hypothetical protein